MPISRSCGSKRISMSSSKHTMRGSRDDMKNIGWNHNDMFPVWRTTFAAYASVLLVAFVGFALQVCVCFMFYVILILPSQGFQFRRFSRDVRDVADKNQGKNWHPGPEPKQSKTSKATTLSIIRLCSVERRLWFHLRKLSRTFSRSIPGLARFARSSSNLYHTNKQHNVLVLRTNNKQQTTNNNSGHFRNGDFENIRYKCHEIVFSQKKKTNESRGSTLLVRRKKKNKKKNKKKRKKINL